MNLKVLLIAITETDIEKFSSVLSSEFQNITFFSANESNDILSEVESTTPDIIIFDIDYPKNQIDQNLDELAKILKSKQLPVIVLSTIKDYKKIFKAGPVYFIQKPFTDISFISNFRSAVNIIYILESVKLKEQEIEEKNQKIKSQIENELIQSELLYRKNKEIMADFRYASRIQQAILPTIELISEITHEYFILHQPKSHVSGDFYWISNQEDKKIIAVGDCTGHGLSGALMHMLGSVYLNEIVSKGNFETASDILEQLRADIMKSLNQTGESGEAQDGLDIAVCIIHNNSSKKLQFAGANNPIYIINNKNITEIKGDRMPVGIHINFDKPFTNHTVNLQGNDQIYLFSDGYADQFGGPKGKKFRYKQFKELLVNISHEPMNIQKEILNNTHDKWRGSAEQIDDILVFGIKIK
ncbi:PP2C family protein-serine/threonine phosphatase [Bacteroidota bacterium]